MRHGLATRRWAARLLMLAALILTAAAVYTLTLVSPQARIPLDWLHQIHDGLPAESSIWGLFITPAALLFLALIMRWSRGWLPARSSRRKALWVGLFIVNLLAAVLQYVLMRDAIAAAALLAAG